MMRFTSPIAFLIAAGVAAIAGASTDVAQQGPVDLAEVFVAANRAYEEGDFSQAIDAYSQLIARGIRDGRIYYNLGNAHLRNGELGEAIAAYRRARILRPRDRDLLANQQFARSAARDAIDPPHPPALIETLLFWYYALGPSELARVVLAVNLVFWVLVIARVFRPHSEVLKWSTVLALVVLVATAGSWIAQRWLSPPVAVVLASELDAHTAPNLDSVVRFKLHAGTELRIRDRREGWARLALPDGQQGWVESPWIEVVDRLRLSAAE